MLSNSTSHNTFAIWRFKVDRTVLIVALVFALCALLGGLSLVYSVNQSSYESGVSVTGDQINRVNNHASKLKQQMYSNLDDPLINPSTNDQLLDDYAPKEDHDHEEPIKSIIPDAPKISTNQPSKPSADQRVKPQTEEHHGHEEHEEEQIVRTFDPAHGHVHSEVKLSPAQLAAKKQRETERAETLIECRDLAKKYSIETGLSWGTSDSQIQKQWRDKDCDTLIGVADYDKYLKDNPIISQAIAIDPARQGPELHTKVNQSIAICVCTTTRGMVVTNLEQLSLFNKLVPTIVDTVEPGFEYWLYIAYDKDDAYFDNEQHLVTVREYLQTKMVDAINKKYSSSNAAIHIGFVIERFENVLHKPGPAFNYLTQLSYLDGATYIYRINDDSSFSTPWAHTLTTTLLSMGLPYGVVGPLCREGNTAILTHDLVHRIHHDIFSTFHYPPSLTDWWMDDWVTRVYGRKRTLRVDSVIVKHATSSHGTRYSVDHSHAKLLDAEVERGRFQIEKWMIDHDIDKAVVEQYQQDEFHFHIR